MPRHKMTGDGPDEPQTGPSVNTEGIARMNGQLRAWPKNRS
jgi:hypothetical protein